MIAPSEAIDPRSAAHLARNYEIYVVDSSGETPANLMESPAFDRFAAWSSDGRLAFDSDRDGGFEIYVIPQSTPVPND